METFGHIQNPEYRIHALQVRLKAFESGTIYTQMKKEHRENISYLEGIIRNVSRERDEANAIITKNTRLWMKTLEDMVDEYEKKIASYKEENTKLSDKLEEAYCKIDELKEQLKQELSEKYAIKVELEESNEKNAAIIAALKNDHTNSSKPSSANPNHPPIPNSRVRSGKSPGAQKGHIHYGRKPLTPTDYVAVDVPEEMQNNPNLVPTGRIITKQLVGLFLQAKVIEMSAPEFRNKITGQRIHPPFPNGIVDDVTYDGSVKAAAYMLNNVCNVSIQKTKDFLKSISNGAIDLSTGFICNLSKEFSEKTEDERNETFKNLVASNVMHSDFTFGRMNGTQTSVIICGNKDAVLCMGREKKGDSGVEGSPLENYSGTVVSDHEAAIIKHGSKHQECLAHVYRQARGASEMESDKTWHTLLMDWITDTCSYKNSLEDGSSGDPSKVEEFENRLHEILEKAKEEYEDIPPSEYYRKGYNLYARMAEKPEDYTLFLHDPEVPTSNNFSERIARVYKRKARAVMCFRSQKGSNYFCDGMSVIETAKCKGENVYQTILRAFDKELAET